jgi:hypothetical protein
LAEQAQQEGSGASMTAAAAAGAKTVGSGNSSTSSGGGGGTSIIMSRYVWYLSVGVPSALLLWGFSDENSPPAQFSRMIGLTDFVGQYTEEIARPSHTKLLPDWSQVRKKT